ncbi:MAG: hypothetical protein AAF492_09230 [Verrucomicrobiota bacterium]
MKESRNALSSSAATLEATEGTRIYLMENGKRNRELLIVTADKAGRVYDVTRL